MSLTRRLRDELSGVPYPDGRGRVAETSALLRFGGAWIVRNGRPGWVLETRAASVLRRAHRSLAELSDERPTLEAHEPTGMARQTHYRLRIWDTAALTSLGLVDGEGHPREHVPAAIVSGRGSRKAYVRGALMAAGGMSGPGQEAHLEIRAPSAQAAADVETILQALDVEGVRAAPHAGGSRVVCKSGEGIAAMLALVGAHGTYLAFDEGRLRRQLRGEATRAANADRANLGRAVAASARQVRTIEGLLGNEAWEGLPSDIQEAALARLANPQAPLTELAELLGTTKATVHRRLLRLEAEAASAATGWVASEDGTGPQ